MNKSGRLWIVALSLTVGGALGAYISKPEANLLRRDGGRTWVREMFSREAPGKKEEVQRFAVDEESLAPAFSAQKSFLDGLAFLYDKLQGNVSIEELEKLSVDMLAEYENVHNLSLHDFRDINEVSFNSFYARGHTSPSQLVTLFDKAQNLLIDKWMKTAPQSAFLFKTEEGACFEHYKLYMAWANYDPEGAIKHAMESEWKEDGGDWVRSLVSEIAGQWSMDSPESAWEWFSKQEGGLEISHKFYDSLEEKHPELIKKFAERDKGAFLEMVESNPHFFVKWCAYDMEEVETWKASLNQQERESIESGLEVCEIYKLAMTDMDAGIKLMEESGISNLELSFQELDKLCKEPRQMLAYAMASDIYDPDGVCEKIFTVHRETAEKLAEEWPPGVDRDRLVQRLLYYDYSDNHQEKLEKSLTIENEEMKASLNNALLRRWKMSDPQGAAEWEEDH